MNLQNSFGNRRVLLLSSYWLIHFSDLHRTLLKKGRQLLATFQKSFAKIREKYEPIGSVPYPGGRECTDPVSEDAILGKGGGDSPDRIKGRQLASDTGGDKT